MVTASRRQATSGPQTVTVNPQQANGTAQGIALKRPIAPACRPLLAILLLTGP